MSNDEKQAAISQQAVPDESAFHVEVCKAMALINQSIGCVSDENGLQAKNILREALFNYSPTAPSDNKALVESEPDRNRAVAKLPNGMTASNVYEAYEIGFHQGKNNADTPADTVKQDALDAECAAVLPNGKAVTNVYDAYAEGLKQGGIKALQAK
jgi:hypothetical protein